MHAVWFCSVVVVPAAQAVHTWSALSVPAVEMYVPGAQIFQAVQVGALVDVPAALMYAPGAHTGLG